MCRQTLADDMRVCKNRCRLSSDEVVDAVMNFLQSLTAKTATPAKEEKSPTAKDAVGAKGTIVGSIP